MPKGSDESWAGKLIGKCNKFPHFEKPRFGTTSKLFSDSMHYYFDDNLLILSLRLLYQTFLGHGRV